MLNRFTRNVACLAVALLNFVCLSQASELTDTIRVYSRACGVPGVLLEFHGILPPPAPDVYLRPAWQNDWNFRPPFDNVLYVAFYDPDDNNGYIPTPDDSAWLRNSDPQTAMIRLRPIPLDGVPAYVDSISRWVRGSACNFTSYDSLLSSIDSFYSGFIQDNVLITIDTYTYRIDRLITHPCSGAFHDSVFVTPDFTYRFRHYADSVGWGYLSHHGGFWQPMWDSVRYVLVGCPESADHNRTQLPRSCQLAQNYPNPFNATTTISYDLPQAGHVSLRLFELLGREVAVLKDGFVEAGSHRVTFDGSNLASGIYFARLDAGKFSQTMKLMLLK